MYLPLLYLRLGTLASMQARIAQQPTSSEEAAFVSVLGGLAASLAERAGTLGVFLGEGVPLGSRTPFGSVGVRQWEVRALGERGWWEGDCNRGVGTVGLGDEVGRWLALDVNVPGDVEKEQRLGFRLGGVKSGDDEKGWEGRLQRGEVQVVYVNQQNEPFGVNVTDVTVDGSGGVVFEAAFPFQEKLLNGLTIAVLVNGSISSLRTVEAVEAATVAGPALVM
jgi:hypothetical protein